MSLTAKLNNKFWAQSSVLNLDHHMRVFSSETSFLETQQLQPLVWFRYIDDIFFIWTHGEEELNIFLKSLNELRLVLSSPASPIKKVSRFLI